MARLARLLLILIVPGLLAGCAGRQPAVDVSAAAALSSAEAPTEIVATEDSSNDADVCPVTQAPWIVPPDDDAVQNEPQSGHYIVNEDRSIWAGAWWMSEEAAPLQAGDDGNKVGWFRPAGAELAITGELADDPDATLQASVPCCYPTRFQATGLNFPVEGCWKVTARAATSELSFVVQVAPAPTSTSASRP